jgi:hypothetical protein
MSGELRGQKALSRRLRAIQTARPLLQTIQLDAVAEAKRLVPRKTGHLGRSIVPGGIGPSFAIVSARTPYAAVVEFGSRPHVIRPKRAGGVLAWPASESGRRLSGRRRTNAGPMVIARKVNHPGTRPQPYLVPGAKAALSRGGFRRIIVKQWNEAA